MRKFRVDQCPSCIFYVSAKKEEDPGMQNAPWTVPRCSARRRKIFRWKFEGLTVIVGQTLRSCKDFEYQYINIRKKND